MLRFNKFLLISLIASAIAANHEVAAQSFTLGWFKSSPTTEPGEAEVQNFTARVMGISTNKPLQAELEVVGQQLKDLKSLTKEFQKDFYQLNARLQQTIIQTRELAQADQHELADRARASYEEQILAMHRKYYAAIGKIILPHQLKRMTQITKQETLKYESGTGDEFGMALAMSHELGLTKHEKNQLAKAVAEAREDYYQKLEAMKKKTHETILRSLPKEKRTKFEEAIGEVYDRHKEVRQILEDDHQNK